MSEAKDTDESIIIQQLNHTLRDLLLLWFSIGFLDMERITWESACDMLQKVTIVSIYSLYFIYFLFLYIIFFQI